MLIQYLNISSMKKLSIVTPGSFFIVGLIVATLLVSTPARAGQNQETLITSGNAPVFSSGTGLSIPLSGLFSLDLNLNSVATGPSSTIERELGVPPIPLSKPPGSDLHYTRFGAGITFRF